MDEFSFIRSIEQSNYRQSSLIKGAGDDAAIFRQPYQDIVTSVDTLVENVHFTRETMDPFHIGFRVLAVNISDLAAMGSTPAFYLVSICVPKHWKENELQEIYSGMKSIASQFEMDLIGGDTTSGSELVISVTIIGYVANNKARYRNTAKGEDAVFVTGTLGDAAAGLYVLKENMDMNSRSNKYLINRHRMPSPRVKFATGLAELARVTLNDISDGIASEASEIAEASGVAMHLYYESIPIHKSLLNFRQSEQRKWMLFGGEDFELIGTVPKKDWPDVQKAADKTNTPIALIGYIEENPMYAGSVFLHEKGKKRRLHKLGYNHLK
ncbi:thiamine-phosphate kinase [Aquibacillus sp. 3ASR75-11]|uniref:Thiamine-monophosphate kinase n=1 Tax=Terrihalobacillus insolitus TaxID=2950438 RepID=A0A9X3WZM8_9BACI|nr:thiamine-phosphate kinase [Terrihalobacillus insolitus]MDC3414235.1 thiamine-phosphate kinase [Terrihalobacillus insolitus]MDC3426214.1 thiamine-phosphate kinase [Terrihalobacillus insolitus]